jgi:hypothetical protein
MPSSPHQTFACMTHLNGVLHKCFSTVCIYMYIVRRQRGKNITAAMNTHTTIEELLYTEVSIRSVSHQRKVRGCFFVSPFATRKRLVDTATRNGWRRRFLYRLCRIKGKEAIGPSQKLLVSQLVRNPLLVTSWRFQQSFISASSPKYDAGSKGLFLKRSYSLANGFCGILFSLAACLTGTVSILTASRLFFRSFV